MNPKDVKLNPDFSLKSWLNVSFCSVSIYNHRKVQHLNKFSFVYYQIIPTVYIIVQVLSSEYACVMIRFETVISYFMNLKLCTLH